MEVDLWWNKLPDIILRIKQLPGLKDVSHSPPPDLLPVVREAGNGDILGMSEVPVILHNFLNSLLILLAQIPGELQHELEVPGSILDVWLGLHLEPGSRD